MTLSDKIGILLLSFIYSLVVDIGIGILTGWEYPWWVVMSLGWIICIPFTYLYQKKDSTCPSCKLAWKATNTYQDIIKTEQILKRETETENGVSRKVNVPYERVTFYQHRKCESCEHTWKELKTEENKT